MTSGGGQAQKKRVTKWVAIIYSIFIKQEAVFNLHEGPNYRLDEVNHGMVSFC